VIFKDDAVGFGCARRGPRCGYFGSALGAVEEREVSRRGGGCLDAVVLEERREKAVQRDTRVHFEGRGGAISAPHFGPTTFSERRGFGRVLAANHGEAPNLDNTSKSSF
jgi:hypothetical protein